MTDMPDDRERLPDLLGASRPDSDDAATVGRQDGLADHNAPEDARLRLEDVAVGDVLAPTSRNGDDRREARDVVDKELLLPVSGFVRLSARELRVVDHPAFQRLFDIHQLGQTHFVYRGATHSRGQHSLGTVHMVAWMIEALDRNSAVGAPAASEHWQLSTRLDGVERTFVRLGALLHDIGHLAAGHTLEDELVVLPPHDADSRLELILDKDEWHGVTVEPLRARIDDLYAEDAARSASYERARSSALSPSEIVVRLISKDHADVHTEVKGSIRFEVCRDLIGNTICADILDYLHRDFTHLGKPAHFDARLLDYLEIQTRRRTAPSRLEHKLVVNLRGGTRPRPDAVTAILELLEDRYQLAEIALFHRTKVTAAAMLERALSEWSSSFEQGSSRGAAMDELLTELLECSDVEMLSLLLDRIERRNDEMGAEGSQGAARLVRSLRIRQLHRELKSYYDEDLHGRGQNVRERFFGDPTLSGDEWTESRRAAALTRLQALRVLEHDFMLKPGSIVLYCPPHGMNTKIAQVNVLRDDTVSELEQMEHSDQDWVTGGHLASLGRRFKRLWRITFAVERATYDRLTEESPSVLDELVEMIEVAVLRQPAKHGTRSEAIKLVAGRLADLPESPWEGARPEFALNRTVETWTYPGGEPSLRSFLAPA